MLYINVLQGSICWTGIPFQNDLSNRSAFLTNSICFVVIQWKQVIQTKDCKSNQCLIVALRLALDVAVFEVVDSIQIKSYVLHRDKKRYCSFSTDICRRWASLLVSTRSPITDADELDRRGGWALRALPHASHSTTICISIGPRFSGGPDIEEWPNKELPETVASHSHLIHLPFLLVNKYNYSYLTKRHRLDSRIFFYIFIDCFEYFQ